MRRVRAFLAFWYDFAVGDDWTVAAGVVLALVVTWGVTRLHVAAWWVMPCAAILLLQISLLRVIRPKRRS